MRKKLAGLAVILFAGSVWAATVVYEKSTGNVIEIGHGDVSRFENDPQYGIEEVSDTPSQDLSKIKFDEGSKTIKFKPKAQMDNVDNGRVYQKILDLEVTKTVLLATQSRGVAVNLDALIDSRITVIDSEITKLEGELK